MIKIGLVGGGHHSRQQHLPALAHYQAENPGVLELTAFCDLNPEVATALAAKHGFIRHYTDIATMLAKEKLDGCIAVTPTHVTAPVARQLILAGIPTTIEKPPGLNPEEARAICQLCESHPTPVMVSVNRRFDPAITAGIGWQSKRPLHHIRATMLRQNRREETFLIETGIHAIDAMRRIAGDIRTYHATSRDVGGTNWYQIALEFASGASGTLEIMPTCGCLAESYELFGEGYRVLMTSGYTDTGRCTAWEDDRQVLEYAPPEGAPRCVIDGTYAETVEFLDSIRHRRAPRPSPADILQTVEISHAIHNQTCKNNASLS